MSTKIEELEEKIKREEELMKPLEEYCAKTTCSDCSLNHPLSLCAKLNARERRVSLRREREKAREEEEARRAEEEAQKAREKERRKKEIEALFNVAREVAKRDVCTDIMCYACPMNLKYSDGHSECVKPFFRARMIELNPEDKNV